MKTSVECLTGLTIELDENDEWTIKPKGKEGINQRFTKLDGIFIYLNPESGDLKFQKVKSMIKSTIEALNDGVAVKEQIKHKKIQFLKTLVELFDRFAGQDEIKNAPRHLGQLLKKMIPKRVQAIGVEVLGNMLYQTGMLENKYKEFLENWEKKTNRECFSERMTTNESLEFFCNIENYAHYDAESENNEVVHYFRDGIVRILSMQLNSSNVERIFKKVHCAAKDTRPNIKLETIHSEIIIAAIRRQHDIFEQLKIPKAKRKWLILP